MCQGKPNIVQMVAFYYTEDQNKCLIQNTVLEFCDQSLYDFMKKNLREQTPMHMVKKFARGLFKGLNSLHNLGIAHRDLKPENVLLKGNDIKIGDLGSAKVLDFSDASRNTPFVVSRYYRAPELTLGSHLYDVSIDVWAAGCIIFELITKVIMFNGDTEGMMLVEI